MTKVQQKPTQKRALATREKILDGLETLLETREFEALSIAELAREAGVAVGSVYSHFKDKDALLPALLDRQMERMQDRLAEFHQTGKIDGIAVEGDERPDLRTAITMSIRGALAQMNQSLGVRRALMTYRRLNPDLEIPLARTLVEQAFDAQVRQLQSYRDEIARDDLNEAAKMVNYFGNIIFLDRIVFINSALQDEMRPDDETLIRTYSDMINHYLTKS
ncbi:MAG: helix-turn-helix domain-containing protein [Pseudomonadota bacterium]